MSEFHDRTGWPAQEIPPRTPDIAPTARHDPPSGLGAFDWRWRHGFAQRRMIRFLAAGEFPAIAGADETVVDDPLTQRRVAALLRGCYVAMSPAEQQRCVALAAVTAARAGIAVHIACADDAAAARMLAVVNGVLETSADTTSVDAMAETPAEATVEVPVAEAAAATAPPLAGLLRNDSTTALRESLTAHSIVCGSVTGFAIAWLRGNGARGPLDRAAARLAGDDSLAFSYAPLLLVVDADRVLLDTIRQPLQLTASVAEPQTRFVHEVIALFSAWVAGEHYEREPAPRLLPAGEAALARKAADDGGLWAVASLVQSEMQAVLAATGLQADVHYSNGEQGFRWLVPVAEIATEDAARLRIERALKCVLGIDRSTNMRQRAWLPEYLLGYARIGAAGLDPGPEGRDVWWLAALPVIDSVDVPPVVTWLTVDEALAPDAVIVLGLRAMQLALAPQLDVLPAESVLCLERAEDRLHATALLAEGKPLRVIGPLASRRHVPDGVSAIILLADAPPVAGGLPPWLATLAARAARHGGAGQALAGWLGRLAFSRQAAHQRHLRVALVERMRQERKTYAFTGRPRDLT